VGIGVKKTKNKKKKQEEKKLFKQMKQHMKSPVATETILHFKS
jgi:hypothetical protein